MSNYIQIHLYINSDYNLGSHFQISKNRIHKNLRYIINDVIYIYLYNIIIITIILIQIYIGFITIYIFTIELFIVLKLMTFIYCLP